MRASTCGIKSDEVALATFDAQCSLMLAVKQLVSKGSGLRSFLTRLGPGLVTGAADDDPSGIGTHSQIGAEFGYGLAWTFVLSFPLMVVI